MHFLTLGLILPVVLARSTPNLAPRDAVCGAKGYNKGSDAYDYYNKKSLGDYAACADKCKGDSNCVSFAYSDSACLLYDVGVYVYPSIGSIKRS